MLEFYKAYADYHDLMALTEDLFSKLAKDICGKTTLEYQKFLSKNLNIVSTVVAATNEPIKEIIEMVDYKKSGWMDPGLLKTHDWSWNKAQDAFEMYRLRQDNVIKIAMSFVNLPGTWLCNMLIGFGVDIPTTIMPSNISAAIVTAPIAFFLSSLE